MIKPKDEKPTGVISKIAERFDIPADAVTGAPLITLTGNRRLHIDHHRGILEYGREFISVNSGNSILSIYGTSLELASMSSSELLLTGDIQRIEFS